MAYQGADFPKSKSKVTEAQDSQFQLSSSEKRDLVLYLYKLVMFILETGRTIWGRYTSPA